jgi:hypothetical protein
VNRIKRAAEALGIPTSVNFRRWLAKIAVAMIAVSGLVIPMATQAATLNSASLALSDPVPSATANYTLTASGQTTGTNIKCIQEVYATTSPGSTNPTNMATNSATLDASSTFITPANWGTNQSTTQGTVVFEDATPVAPAAGSGKTFQIDGVTNSSASTTSGYWMTFSTYQTFSGAACTGSPVDTVLVGFFITGGSTMTLTVNPTLSFSVAGEATPGTTSCNGATSSADGTSTGTAINFGTVSTSKNDIVCQQLSAATNATNGYTINMRDTGQMANTLAQTLADWGGTYAVPTTWSANGTSGTTGTEGYGFTTDGVGAFNSSGPLWAHFNHANTGDNALNNYAVGSTSAPIASGTYNIGFQAGVSSTTHPGTYTTTVVYTCTPEY